MVDTVETHQEGPVNTEGERRSETRKALKAAMSEVQQRTNQTEEAAAALRGDESKPVTPKQPDLPEEAKPVKKEAKAPKEEKPAKPKKPEKAPEPKAEAQTKAERERDERGKFKAKEQAPAEPAPTEPEPPKPAPSTTPPPRGFKPEVNEKWAAADPELQSEVTRRIGELEQGIGRYQQTFEKLKPYDEMARNSGTDIVTAMENYVRADKMLVQDFAGNLPRLAEMYGADLNEVASKILDRPLSEYADEANKKISTLANENKQLKAHLGRLMKAEQDRAHAAVQDFKAKAPRWGELETEIAYQLKQSHPGMPTAPLEKLEWAYKRAEQLIPAAAKTVPQPTEPANDAPVAQTDKAELSPTGAPPEGSNPKSRGKPGSLRDSLKAGLAQAKSR